MEEVANFWHKCRECPIIFEESTDRCPSCNADNPEKVKLTLTEVFDQFGVKGIRTKVPGQFDEVRAKKEKASA